MVTPNIYATTSIIGKTDVLAVTTTATAITTCAANKIYKINSVIVANIDGTNSADITVGLLRSAVSYNIANTITVPADSTLVVISKDMGIYLEENDALRLTASAAGDLQAFCSYEIIDDA
jgi:hypothetical protein